MESHRTRKTRHSFPLALQAAGGTVAICLLLAAAPAMAETVVSGQSDTIFRIVKPAADNVNIPIYEYLRFNLSNIDSKGGVVSANFGAWGRNNNRDEREFNADVQYGYISYQAAKNNFITSAGRQFVVEGVASEKIDGLYLRSDVAAGFAAAAFAGKPVVTEPSYPGNGTIYGGRVSHTNNKYYTVGVSALKMSSDLATDREEVGADLWLHPMKEVDVAGRSAYNSLLGAWMEHAYTVSVIPNDKIRISADVSQVNYRYYFSDNQTSAVFRLNSAVINPNEDLLALGANLSYALDKHYTVSADFKNYNYAIAKSAEYFGAKVTYVKPEAYSAGATIHRMQGGDDRLRYTEYRIYAAKELHAFDVTLDLMDINYDTKVNGTRDAFTAVAGVGYRINDTVKVTADLDYATNPDFQNEVKALVKMTIALDSKSGKEGGHK